MKRVLAVAAATVILVVAVVLYARLQPPPPVNTRVGDPKPDTPASSGLKTDPPATPAVLPPVNIVLECAEPQELQDTDPRSGKKVMVVEQMQAGAEAMKVLRIPDGWQNDFYKDETREPGKWPGLARYRFQVPREADYYIFIRALWLDKCGNSLFLRVDETPFTTIEKEEIVYEWTWYPLAEHEIPVPHHLKAGTHLLELATREDGPMFHRLLISTGASCPLKRISDPRNP